jgi:hypothetical protein
MQKDEVAGSIAAGRPRFEKPSVLINVAQGVDTINRFARAEAVIEQLVSQPAALQESDTRDGSVIKFLLNLKRTPHRNVHALALRPPQRGVEIQCTTGFRVK